MYLSKFLDTCEQSFSMKVAMSSSGNFGKDPHFLLLIQNFTRIVDKGFTKAKSNNASQGKALKYGFNHISI